MRGVIPRIFEIQHRMNPLHLYCRCMERGYGRGSSLFYCRIYEVTVFSWMRRILRGALLIAFTCGGGYRDSPPSRLAGTGTRDEHP